MPSCERASQFFRLTAVLIRAVWPQVLADVLMSAGEPALVERGFARGREADEDDAVWHLSMLAFLELRWGPTPAPASARSGRSRRLTRDACLRGVAFWFSINPRALHPVFSQARQDRGFQVRLRRRHRQIDISIGDGVEQRANELRATDGCPVLRTDVSRQPIEKYDLPVEQDDGDLGPSFVVNRRTSGLPFYSGRPSGGRNNIRRWFDYFAPATSRHSNSPRVPVLVPALWA